MTPAYRTRSRGRGRKSRFPRPLGGTPAEPARPGRRDTRTPAAKELASYAKRLRVVWAAERHGASQAARMHGVSPVTVWRWSKAWRSKGPDGLHRGYHRCGAIPYAAVLDQREIAVVQRAYVDARSMREALQVLKASPLCSDRTRGLVDRLLARRTELPGSIRDLIRRRGDYSAVSQS